MNRRPLSVLVAVVALAVVGLIVNLALGNSPTLGLDNQGGLRLVVVADEPEDVTPAQLIATRDALQRELVAHRVVDGSVRIEGTNVVVDVPRVDDQPALAESLAASNRMQLRPFSSQCFDPNAVVETTVAGSTPESTVNDSSPQSSVAETSTADDATTVAESSAPATTIADTTAAPETTVADSAATSAGFRRPASSPETTTPDTSAAETSTPDTTGSDSSTPESSVAEVTTTTEPWLGPVGADQPLDGTTEPGPLTPPPAGDDDLAVDRPLADGSGLLCNVGPAGRLDDGQGSGQLFRAGTAVAEEAPGSNGVWIVTAEFATGGFTASQSAGAQGGQMAVLLDDTIYGIAQADSSFTSLSMTIQAVDEASAVTLADAINRGAFGFPGDVQVVDGLEASIGDGAWTTVVIAGLIGAVLVGLGLVSLYRRLGIIWAAASVVWALWCWGLAALLSMASGFAIGLGTALVFLVFFGVLTGGSVLYFERLRDDVRHRRKLRNSAPRSFTAIWRRLLAFDVAVAVAAILLMSLSGASGRSFGAFLGIATVSHAVVMVGFLRSAVQVGINRRWLDGDSLFPAATTSEVKA